MEKDDAKESDDTREREHDAPKRDGSRKADAEFGRRKREHHQHDENDQYGVPYSLNVILVWPHRVIFPWVSRTLCFCVSSRSCVFFGFIIHQGPKREP